MSRSMSAAYLAAITSQQINPVLFVQVNFTTGPVYVWSGVGNIYWNGITWSGVGSLGSISVIEEGANVQARGITLTLSGIDATLLTGILTEFQQGLPAIVYLGLLDASGNLIASPIISWSGRSDQPSVTMDGQTATISINCENRLVDMNVAVDRRYTNEDQQLDHPGDRGMEFVSSIQDVMIYWG